MGVVQGSIPCKSIFLPFLLLFMPLRFVGGGVVLRQGGVGDTISFFGGLRTLGTLEWWKFVN
jgi:hypothetical protein